jgi:hypothetical protein
MIPASDVLKVIAGYDASKEVEWSFVLPELIRSKIYNRYVPLIQAVKDQFLQQIAIFNEEWCEAIAEARSAEREIDKDAEAEYYRDRNHLADVMSKKVTELQQEREKSIEQALVRYAELSEAREYERVLKANLKGKSGEALNGIKELVSKEYREKQFEAYRAVIAPPRVYTQADL